MVQRFLRVGFARGVLPEAIPRKHQPKREKTAHPGGLFSSIMNEKHYPDGPGWWGL